MRSKRLSTIESGQSFERKFLLELVSNCDQLDESERGAIALFTMDLPKANLVGVIQKVPIQIKLLLLIGIFHFGPLHGNHR